MRNKQMVRSITEILIEADKSTELKQLCNAWDEVKSNLKKYPLIQIEFVLAHLQGLARKMAQKDLVLIQPLIEFLKE